jgi:uncharacterized membrane protein
VLLLIMGIAVFLGVHLVPTRPALRDDLRQRFGAVPYQLGFSVLSLLGLALIVYGYGRVPMLPGKNPVLWAPPSWAPHLVFALMVPAFILLAAAYIPSRIRDRVGHPMLLSVAIWAVAHLLVNGRLAAVLLFGSFLAWAVIDLISVKQRGAVGPLGQRRGTVGGDVAAVATGLSAWVVMLLWGHAKLIGVALVSSSFAP